MIRPPFIASALAIALAMLAEPTATAAPRQRADVPAEFKWDFSPIFADWAAWEAGMADMERRMDAFAKLKGSLAQGPQALLAA